MPSTSLAEWLRSLSDDALAALLRTRRDLATPPPSDSIVLATRAGTPGSVARACEDLDTFTLAVLESLLVAGADEQAVDVATVTALLGRPPGGTLSTLRGKALAWGEDDALRVPPSAREVFGPYPAGLGAPAPDGTLPADGVEAALERLGEPELALLRTLDAGPPIGRTRDASPDGPATGRHPTAQSPVRTLLGEGLLRRRDAETVELPLEVGMALRGGQAFADSRLDEPELPTNPHSQSTVDSAAGGEAMEFLRHMETLLTLWSDQPPPVLKSGGLGVRELRRLAKECELDDVGATVLAELAVGAGLVADSQSTTPEWVPTVITDSWLASGPAQRWIPLAIAWLELPRMPGLAGGRDAKDKPIAPLTDELRRPLAPAARHRVLRSLAELPNGAGVKSVEELVTVLAWRAPRRGGRFRDDTVRQTMSEASAIGLIAMGALSTAAAALLDEDRAAATSAIADALPEPVDHFLVQADLTVVAPGPLEPELAARITAVADVESAGHATVYRVTETSVRRALDAGRTADELHELFRVRSATPVPQTLTYLIDDVARRHGRLRGGAAGSFLRCDDEVLIAEVLGNPAAADLDLRRIAPTVLVSSLPLAEVLDGLRAAGFVPAAEAPDGRVLDLRPSGRRIPARPKRARPSIPAPSGPGTEQLDAIVVHIRAGDRATTSKRGTRVSAPRGGGSDTSATLALLAEATRTQREVWIGFVDSHGMASQRIVTPVRVGGGVLEGEENERYPLHRITSAALVED